MCMGVHRHAREEDGASLGQSAKCLVAVLLLPLLRARRSDGLVCVTAVSAILEMCGIEPESAGIAHNGTELC